MSTEPPFFPVSSSRVRHLRDGREAFPAMLEAIRAARREVLLEMYWVGADAVGERFRDALAERAAAEVTVRVIHDAFGSLGLPSDWWEPLLGAGGEVALYGALLPWQRRFRPGRLRFRDHRKNLVVDGEVAFCGGINLARQWLPVEEGGEDWRDDVIELRGPAARDLRTLFYTTWRACERAVPDDVPAAPSRLSRRLRVLANRFDPRPRRAIRGAYVLAIRRAQASVDIASAYFLPNSRFLRALRAARRRGVRVRVLVPKVSDVWLVSLAMDDILANLLRHGVEVFAYRRSILHSKLAVIDRRHVIAGSHNLDTLSWRFDLESNVVVDDPAFGAAVCASFERDLAEAEALDLAALRRPLLLRLLAWVARKLRFLL